MTLRLCLATMVVLTLVPPVGAAAPPVAADFAADARSIEGLVDSNYAYLERFAGQRMPMTDRLRAEAGAVASEKGLVRFAERALALLADHHAITGSSFRDSWAVFPSYGDVWVERRGGQFVITAVRDSSPAFKAGVRRGDVLLAIDGQPTAAAIAAYWADLGAVGGGERDDHAARVLVAGRRDRPRRLTIGAPLARRRDLVLPNLYADWRPPLPPVSVITTGRTTRIRFNDALGDSATISAFDAAMAKVGREQRLELDLTDTSGGGNTVVARAILGWFVRQPTSYQVHTLPAEERKTGIPRQWVEQVLPRTGKFRPGPVTVQVGRWTGSMGEGLAIGFAALGKRVEGERMAGLLGAIYDHRLQNSGKLIKFPTERLAAVDGTPREKFVPAAPLAR